jgi:hypothetical protein
MTSKTDALVNLAMNPVTQTEIAIDGKIRYGIPPPPKEGNHLRRTENTYTRVSPTQNEGTENPPIETNLIILSIPLRLVIVVTTPSPIPMTEENRMATDVSVRVPKNLSSTSESTGPLPVIDVPKSPDNALFKYRKYCM